VGIGRGTGRASGSGASGGSRQLCRPGVGRAVLARVSIRKLCCQVAPGSAPIRRRSLTELNVRVLRALEPSRYQTIDAVTELLAVQRFVARAELTRLRKQELVEDNGEHPLAFRRTVLGDDALKWFG
jgi:hypothetical protein